MTSLFHKLTIICNGCFWVSFGLRYWSATAAMPQTVVSTVAVLGVVALVVNLAWLAGILGRRSPRPGKVALIFNAATLIFQLVSLYFYLS